MTTENAISGVPCVCARPVHDMAEPRHRSMRFGTAAGKAICRF
jgi:hypothetical protein